MRLIDADNLENQYKKLISDAETEREKYDPEKDPRSWEIWTVVLTERYNYLVDLIRADKIECKPKHPYWMKQGVDPTYFKCTNCGYVTLKTSPNCPQCHRPLMGGNHDT